jgi:integrase
VAKTPAGKVTLTGLLEGWWREGKAGGMKQATYDNYGGAVRLLRAFLGHDDAERVTPDDVVRFKEYRLNTPSSRTGKPVSARTVKDNDLAGLRSIFGWGVANRKLPSNPVEGISVKVRKPAKLRPNGFRPEEVTALLSACLRLRQGQQSSESFSLKRWVPWLLAYTGARVGEMVQLRKQDVFREGDHWTIRITPEAGTVKGNEAREVPLHPHLVELGFPAFVEHAPAGYLFIRPDDWRARRLPEPTAKTTTRGKRILTKPASPPTNDPAAATAGKVKGAKNHLREFARQYVPDPNVQPNHAWRHLFITRCREVGIEEGQQYRLVGHTAKSVHERYGEAAGLYREICRLPRFKVD